MYDTGGIAKARMNDLLREASSRHAVDEGWVTPPALLRCATEWGSV